MGRGYRMQGLIFALSVLSAPRPIRQLWRGFPVRLDNTPDCTPESQTVVTPSGLGGGRTPPSLSEREWLSS